MERGGALNLAYSTVTHLRISMLERGPASARGAATLQQARVLRQMGLLEEASDTYGEAREDAVRANDRELEARAYLGEAVVAGQRGDYPTVRKFGSRALELLPEKSPMVANAHNNLMVAALSADDFGAAFDHGWRGYDASAHDVEMRATLIGNLSSLALRRGRFTAARRGFLATLGLSQIERIAVPVLGSLALVSAATRNEVELQRVSGMIDRAAVRATLPYELARTRFELAQSWKEIGNLEKAEESLTCARDLASAHGFREVEFKSEILAEALAMARDERTSADERVEQAIARFEDLPVSDHVLVQA
jgi:tetratricopeptide (TPR) repeat protein